MDKELLEILSNLFDEKLKPIQDDIKDMKSNQEQIKKDIHSIFNQTANLTEFNTTVNTKLDRIDDAITKIEKVTKENC